MIRERSLALLRWFYPGLGVKRWLVIALFGALLFINGVNRYLVAEGLHAGLSWLEQAKLLEVLLRNISADEVGAAAGLFLDRWQALGRLAAEVPSLLRTLFNEVALSPWTGFVDRALAFERDRAEIDRFGPVDPAVLGADLAFELDEGEVLLGGA